MNTAKGTQNPIEKVNDFLTQAGTFYMSTVDGDKPKCRPLGFHLLENDKIYFGVGDFKDVYKQMRKNPQVEFCATGDGGFLRYYGRAVFEDNDAIAQKALAAAPSLQQIYNETTGYKLAIFHLEDATAEFRGMLDVKECYHF